MDIRIFAHEGVTQTVRISVFGLGFELSGLERGCSLAVGEDGGVLSVALIDTGQASVCAADDTAVAPDGAGAGAVQLPCAGGREGLFQRLSELRKRIATEEGVPTYVVFKDKTLLEMTEKLPMDLEALSIIGGVGKAKLDKYGEAFLLAIKGAAV